MFGYFTTSLYTQGRASLLQWAQHDIWLSVAVWKMDKMNWVAI